MDQRPPVSAPLDIEFARSVERLGGMPECILFDHAISEDFLWIVWKFPQDILREGASGDARVRQAQAPAPEVGEQQRPSGMMVSLPALSHQKYRRPRRS